MVLSSSNNTSSSCLCGTYYNDNETDILDEATDLPVCDYDVNPTPLYKAMEQHQWAAVANFLKTGVWPGHFFTDVKTPKDQAKTWIHRYDDSCHEIRDDDNNNNNAYGDQSTYYHSMALVPKNTKGTIVSKRSLFGGNKTESFVGGSGKKYLRWRQLPLHAALIFLAPPSVVKQLIEAFPYALRCPDDKGMLPLHLAFRQAVPDDILTILLRLFPNGMHVRDHKGRLPVECVRVDLLNTTSAQQPVRGMIIQSIMQQSKEKFSKEQDNTIKTFQKDIGDLKIKMHTLEQDLKIMNEREKNTQQELSATLEELHTLKKSHKKLQELQRFAIERQSHQEALDRQTQSFQQRIMEQLDMAPQRSRSRGRSHSRSRGRDSPRDHPPTSSIPIRRSPSTPPSRQESRTATYLDETPSYSSGNSSVPNAFTGATGYTTAKSYTTRATTQYDDGAETGGETDLDDHTATLPLHPYQSIFDRRRRDRRPIAKAIYPVKTESGSLLGVTNTSKPNDKTGRNSSKNSSDSKKEKEKATAEATATAAAKPSSSPMNWNFSFTPGFLSPLSVKQL